MASSLLRSNLSLFSLYPPTTTQPITTNTPRSFLTIRCGPRDNRGPLVKGRVLSTEAIQAVQSLKRAHRLHDQSKLNHLLSRSISRLIKPDLIATFNELLRQDHCDLALKVFSSIRSEFWYKTDLGLYADLVSALARKGMTEDIDRLICDLEEGGVIECDDKGLVRLVKALIAAERVESTVRIYGLMKRSGWGATSVADEYVAKVLSRGLRRLGEWRLADEIDVEFDKFFRGVFDKVRLKHGETVEWTSKDLRRGLKEFVPIYETRPIKNMYGMGFDHNFGLWFIARWLKPDLMIESGAFKGHSTWVLQQAMPDKPIVSLSPRQPEKYQKKGTAYVDGNCTYFAGKDFVDFRSLDWRSVFKKHEIEDRNRVLVFFDDHQNELKQLKQALKAGFRHLVFEDNYDTGTGDHYSFGQTCDQYHRRGSIP